MFDFGSGNLMPVEYVGVLPDRVHSADSPTRWDGGRIQGDPRIRFTEPGIG